MRATIASLTCLVLAAGASAVQPETVTTADGVELPANWPEVVAGQYPFGHAQFTPSPGRPVGYRGAQNGWYPGAEPPLHWWDGTPAQVKMKVRRRGRVKEREVWTVTDRKARNIRFKTPLPGWSLSSPLPVRGRDGRLRVIVKCHPWWVLCVDGQTGEVLWKDQLSPFHCMDLSRKEADRRAEVLTLVWAANDMVPVLLGHRHDGLNKNHRTIPRQSDPGLYERLQAALAGMSERMEQLEPELAGGVDAVAGLIREGLPEQVKDAGARKYNAVLKKLTRQFRRRYNVPTYVWFHGYTGLAMPTAVSDGEHAYVTFGQGQVACYTLDGERRWARLVLDRDRKRSMYYASPALIDGRLIFYEAPDQKSALVALDAATGRELWRIDGGTPWAKVAFTSVRPVRLPLPDGETLGALLARHDGSFKVIRARDGKVLATLCKTGGYSAGPNFVRSTLITAFSRDGRDLHDPAVRLRAISRSEVEGKQAYDLFATRAQKGRGVSSRPTAVTPAGIFDGRRNTIFDPRTGKQLATFPVPHADRRRGLTVNIAGHYAIMAMKAAGVGFGERGRADNWALMRFSVFDVADPAKPKPVSNRNVLVSPKPPADLTFDRHLAPYGLEKGRLLGGYKTILAHFGCANGGPIPHGGALFIQSATHLYGIAQGPGSREDVARAPKEVGAE